MDALRRRFHPDHDDDEDELEVNDEDAEGLSHVGQAAYEVLSTQHAEHHLHLWNVTSGTVIGELDQTPKDLFVAEEDPPEGHSDWFPVKMGEIMKRTVTWCDVMSLAPPDGKFLEELRDAMTHIHRNADPENPPVIRMMFGNIIGMPVNCTAVVEALTRDLGPDPNLLLWVGSWRNGVSWNHAKMIAVDGKYLHTGGHNMWDKHYLRHSPVFDLSLELKGSVTHDGHMFANNAWKYIKHVQGSFAGRMMENLPDYMATILKGRVIVTDYPADEAAEFPPLYQRGMMPEDDGDDVDEDAESAVKIISMGRTGSGAHPSDDAFVAMIDSAQTIVRMALQDLGPVCFPGTQRALPGCKWPHSYMQAIARVIWEKGVDVEILLSNPHSVPAGLSMTEANYGNGWSCVDVASEIIKEIQKQFPDAEETALAEKVQDNLRICFLRCANGNAYDDGATKGMHAKHFMVDDICAYVGSQNLYVCDLSEWGVVIDNAEQTEAMKASYWDPMWEQSYTGEDVDVDAVMEGLGIDRDGDDGDTDEDKMAAAKAMTCHSSEYCEDHDEE